MFLKKFKKVLLPLVIIKLLIFIIFIFKSDLVSFSREFNYTGYQQGFENDTVVQKKPRLIRIVRNEDEKGIVIKVRKKTNTAPFRDNRKDPSTPVFD